MDDLSDRIRAARVRAGHETGTDAARAVGLSISTYLGYENGDRKPSRQVAAKLARAFKVSLDWLVTGRQSPAGTDPADDDPNWVSLHGMPDDAKTHVRGMIEIMRKSTFREN